jgi:hypothetical protein
MTGPNVSGADDRTVNDGVTPDVSCRKSLTVGQIASARSVNQTSPITQTPAATAVVA